MGTLRTAASSYLMALVVVATACDDAQLEPAPREGLLLERATDVLPETDAPSLHVVTRVHPETGERERVAERARDATTVGDRVYAVLEDGRLVVVEGERRRVLLDRVTRGVAVLEDGSVVAPRRGDEPGETDLWIAPPAGSPRALAPAPGPDDKPVALPDGRVAFVSGRTTVASLWIADPKTGAATQLTNRGLVAGGSRAGFVPPPAGLADVVGGALVYDAGGGAMWRVDLETGRAERLEESEGVGR